MSDTKHTPGPEIFRMNRTRITLDCGCYAQVLPEFIVMQRCTLHEAAPDLLGALERLLAVVGNPCENIPHEIKRCSHCAATAAIAKAKGGAP